MCGIAGIINFSKKNLNLQNYIKRMTDTIRYRGPDDEGFVLLSDGDNLTLGGDNTPEEVWNSKLQYTPKAHILEIKENESYNIVLGHRRLSIIDLSAAGHQPMCSEDGKLWIVFNGEIYNYVELRNDLKDLGYKFKTNTDTEVILGAYRQWGIGCLSKFNGMWAFCVVDLDKKKLISARDRTGVKPFYYWFDGDTFSFASEIKSLLQLPFIKSRPNIRMIWGYLVMGFLDYNEETLFEGIYSLEPAHYLQLDFKGNLSTKRYWQLDANFELGKFNAERFRKSAGEFREILFDAVRLRLRSDVPIGSCLSGGLDSSTVVCVVNELLKQEGYISQIGERQKTFTSAFEDKRFDEREFVEEIIKQTKAEPFYTFPTMEDCFRDLTELIYHQEEPFGSTSIYAQYCVMRRAKEAGVKVMLDGQGGDELLSGYHQYYQTYFANMLMTGNIWNFANELVKSSKITGKSIPNFLLQINKEFGRTLPYFMQFDLLKRIKWELKYIHSDFLNSFKERGRIWFEERGAGNLGKRLAADITKYNLPGLLRYEDKNSMAFSIETRVPFADDHRLIEMVSSLPNSFKIHNGWTKYILRYATYAILPEKIRWRKDKKGFVTPERIWLNNAKEKVKDILSECKKGDEYINSKKLIDDINLFLNPEDQVGISEIWKFINLKLWLKEFF